LRIYTFYYSINIVSLSDVYYKVVFQINNARGFLHYCSPSGFSSRCPLDGISLHLTSQCVEKLVRICFTLPWGRTICYSGSSRCSGSSSFSVSVELFNISNVCVYILLQNGLNFTSTLTISHDSQTIIYTSRNVMMSLETSKIHNGNYMLGFEYANTWRTRLQRFVSIIWSRGIYSELVRDSLLSDNNENYFQTEQY
jgi:hypothetical protein